MNSTAIIVLEIKKNTAKKHHIGPKKIVLSEVYVKELGHQLARLPWNAPIMSING